MKKRILFVVLVVGFIAVLSSCKGSKHATPCPAYSQAQTANSLTAQN